MTLTGSDTYSSKTIVQAGTLVVNSRLNSTKVVQIDRGATLHAGVATVAYASLIMNGGTFETAGLDQTFDTGVTLAGAATINLGGKGTFLFSNSATKTWSGTLSITNWDGSTTGGGTTVFKAGYGSSYLTSDQLADIIFDTPVGSGLASNTNYGAKILSSGEVVPDSTKPLPIPEPSTVVLALIFGTGMLFFFRRRRIA